MSIVGLSTICAFTLPGSLPTRTNRPSKTTPLNLENLLGGLFGSAQQQGPKTILDLPASTIKIGALRFFLQIYLVGEQNKPSKGSWVLRNNDDTNSLDMYYKDGTGMFSLGLEETGIKVLRFGERPSLEYALQESLMLHGVLDELNTIAFEVHDIEQEKRLLQFTDAKTIEKARESLPARKEPN